MSRTYHQTHSYTMPETAPATMDVRMKLSPNFRLGEFTKSRTADRYQLHNIPREEAEIANLRALATHVLEPVRALFGKYVIVTSGFRCTTLNRLVGGSATSQHLLGEAADIVIRGVPCLDAATAIAATDIPFDQLIYEARERDGGRAEWLHVSYRRLGRNRREALTIVKTADGRQVFSGICPVPEAKAGDRNMGNRNTESRDVA